MKDALEHFAHNVTGSPAVAGTAATATTGIGVSTVFGWLEKGVGFTAAILGLVVTFTLWRKLRLEHRAAQLQIQFLEQRLKSEQAPKSDEVE